MARRLEAAVTKSMWKLVSSSYTIWMMIGMVRRKRGDKEKGGGAILFRTQQGPSESLQEKMGPVDDPTPPDTASCHPLSPPQPVPHFPWSGFLLLPPAGKKQPALA